MYNEPVISNLHTSTYTQPNKTNEHAFINSSEVLEVLTSLAVALAWHPSLDPLDP